MQIPLTLPDQTTPLPARRDIQALSPVSPVPGVEGQAETLDPRLALQWTQPVLGDQSTDLTRSVLEGAAPPPSPGEIPAESVAKPQPMIWSSLAQLLGPLLQRIGDVGSSSTLSWPGHLAHPIENSSTSLADGADVVQALHTLRTQLAESDVFAPHHLVRHWFKPPDNATREIDATVQETPDDKTLTRWVAALSPDSDTAERITQMLVNGRMQWQGELLPGIAVTLDREDAWREDPQHPGQAQKGVSLRAQIELPRLGRLTVVGQQWGEHMHVRVILPNAMAKPLELAWPLLEERLSGLNLPDLHLERASAA